MHLSKQLIRGAEIHPHLAAIARLRIDIFKEYPYLYKGAEQYELDYLKVYAASQDALAILAWDGPTLAGAATAIPLQDEMQEFTAPFADTPYPVGQIYYIGELLFYPAYRGCGMGTALLEQVESLVLDMDKFSFLTCATVVRPDDHPMKYDEFIPIDRFLHRHAFARLPEITANLHWPELDGASLDHTMQFWLKKLR